MATAPTDKPPARNSRRQDEIVEALREQILYGTYQPGDRLPSQLELVRTFNASTITIKHALDRLVEQGVVRSEPRQGVFVSDHPPHLVDYCLIFPHPVAKMAQTNRFLFSLSQIAEGLSAEGPKRASIYCGIEAPDDQPAYRDLVHQVETRGMAGLIFLTPPTAFADTPIITTPGIPRVAVMGGSALPGVTAVHLHGFTERAMDHLAQRGCRRAAMVTAPQWSETDLAWFGRLADERGVALPRHHILGIDPHDARWAHHALRLLMSLPADQRPDGLIITDDNLVPQATAGLLAADPEHSSRCHVAALANFPWVTDAHVPAMRIGPDTHQVFQTCLDLIDRARQGERIPPRIEIDMIERDDTQTDPTR